LPLKTSISQTKLAPKQHRHIAMDTDANASSQPDSEASSELKSSETQTSKKR